MILTYSFSVRCMCLSFHCNCSTVAATLCPHCFDENAEAEDSEEDDSAVKKWADCPLLRHLAHLQRPRNMTRYGETISAQRQHGATLSRPAQSPPLCLVRQ